MYACECGNCKPDTLQLSFKDDLFKNLLKTVSTAFKSLFENGSYKPSDLKTNEAYQQLIKDTSTIFKEALKNGISDNVIPDVLKNALENDIFLFSALKTHAQLFEASRLLKDEKGSIKSFNQFSIDIQKIKTDYNQLYLEAEYEFAVSSSLSNQKWNDFEENGDRYNLQYRTAGDEKVRQSHQVLDLVTLPVSDPFWNNYFPPNGWRCRCTTIEVLKDKYSVSNSKESIKKGDKATTQIGNDRKNRLEIFRFNPGKQKVIFPPSHPYSKVTGADKVKQQFKKK